MLSYFVESMTWSFVCLMGGAACAQIICDHLSHPQHERRHRRDHT